MSELAPFVCELAPFVSELAPFVSELAHFVSDEIFLIGITGIGSNQKVANIIDDQNLNTYLWTPT